MVKVIYAPNGSIQALDASHASGDELTLEIYGPEGLARDLIERGATPEDARKIAEAMLLARVEGPQGLTEYYIKQGMEPKAARDKAEAIASREGWKE